MHIKQTHKPNVQPNLLKEHRLQTHRETKRKQRNANKELWQKPSKKR